MSNEYLNPAEQVKVLHVVGSPDSEFYLKLSRFYASSCHEFGQYAFLYAVVHPGGVWSFPKSLHDIDTEINQPMPLDEAKSKILQMKPDVIIHHMFCKKGHSEYRGIVESLNIPVIGSTAEVTSVTQSKGKTRKVLQQIGVRVPQGQILEKGDKADRIKDVQFPCVIKPDISEDSVGVSLVKGKDQLNEALEKAFQYGSVAVIERFIAGREIRIGIISDSKDKLKVLNPIEYLDVKKDEIRSFNHKLVVDDKGLPIGKAPSTKTSFLDVNKEPEIVQRLSESAIAAFRALELRDFAGFDFRVDDNGIPWLLEVNLFCCFGEKSVISSMAQQVGISCQQLINQMVKNALTRNVKKQI